MLKHTEIKKGRIIEMNNDPYEVLEHSHKVKGRGRSVMQTKIKNMRTGAITKKTFQSSDEVEEADIERMSAVFIYSRKGKYFFHKEGDPSYRFDIDEEQIGENKYYLKEDIVIDTLFFDEKIIGISLPIKVTLKVVEAPPGIRGNTSEGGTKPVTLETGKEVDVPLFIETGDILEINTETGRYSRRIN